MSLTLTRQLITEAVQAVDSGRGDVAKSQLYLALGALNKAETELRKGLKEVGKQNNFYHISPEVPEPYPEKDSDG